MRKALTAAAAAVVTAVWAAPASATHVFVIGDAFVSVDAMNDCTGEVERFSGLFEHQVESGPDGSGGVRGFGTMFGTNEPKFTGRFTAQETSRTEGRMSHETLVITALLSDDSRRRLSVHVVSHVTVGADGVVTEVEKVRTTCIGRPA